MDDAKTSHEREINRKLDALKTAVLALGKYAYALAKIAGYQSVLEKEMSALLKAWKEDE